MIAEDSPDLRDYDRASPSRPLTKADIEDRPREKAEAAGCGQLTVADLWALVLRTGLPGKPVTELTRDLMKANGSSLHTLERRSRKELQAFKGIGLTKAIQIEAVLELIRRYNMERTEENPLIRSSEDIYNTMRPRMGNLPHEEIWVLLLDRRHAVRKVFRASSGGTNATVFDIKLIMKEAVLEHAEALVLCHNHPSGNLSPSRQDDDMTRKCSEACKIFSIRMLDHLIVTENGFYSYGDHGRLS